MLSTFAQKYPSTYNPPHFLNEGTNIILPQPPGCAIRDKAYCSVSFYKVPGLHKIVGGRSMSHIGLTGY